MSDAAYEHILVDVPEEGVGRVTLNRPAKLNALSFALTTELDRALAAFEEDDAIRAVVVTGAGERAFSAGADIHEMASLSAEEAARRGPLSHAYQWRVAGCRKPTIGAINGLAFGGGALLASSLDLRVGCERTRFRFLAASYGRVNSTWTLPLVVGLPMAKELLYTGREVGAEEAYRIGLLNRLVPAERLMDEALELARAIAANTPQMVQGIKELLHQGLGLSLKERQELEADARRTRLVSAPPQEGFRDFLARKGGRPE